MLAASRLGKRRRKVWSLTIRLASAPKEAPRLNSPARVMVRRSTSVVMALPSLMAAIASAYSPRAPRSNSTVSGNFSLSSCWLTSGKSKAGSSGAKPSTCTVALRRVWGFFQVMLLTYRAVAVSTPGISWAWSNRRREKVETFCRFSALGLISTTSANMARLTRVLLSYSAPWKPNCMNISTSAKAIPARATNKRPGSWHSCSQPRGVRRCSFLTNPIIVR